MSTLERYTATVVSLDYRGEDWEEDQIKLIDRRLKNYYNSAQQFLKGILEELSESKFPKDAMLTEMMKYIQKNINDDKEFRDILVGLGDNYPTNIPDPKHAQTYVRYLKKFSLYISVNGEKLNENVARMALFSDMPYIFFSDLLLGNYVTSCFHKYIVQMTEDYFRNNMILIQGHRVKAHQKAMTNYFKMLEPLKNHLRELGKAHLLLFIYATSQNSKDLKEFISGSTQLLMRNLDEQEFSKLYNSYKKKLEEFRLALLQKDLEIFKPIINEKDPAFVAAMELVELRM